jgi:hypothetical protein
LEWLQSEGENGCTMFWLYYVLRGRGRMVSLSFFLASPVERLVSFVSDNPGKDTWQPSEEGVSGQEP